MDQTVVLARATPEGEAEYLALVTQLRQIWPDLEPIPEQPKLSRIDVLNGVWVFGRRDYNSATDTYLTYRVYRAYAPVFFLGAYRVCEGPVGNLVFLGRHPLPPWARAWNAVGVAMLACLAYVITRSIWMESLR